MEVLCRIFIDDKANVKAKFHVMRMMFGGQIDEFDFHYFGWNLEFLKDYLSSAGFKKIEKVPKEIARKIIDARVAKKWKQKEIRRTAKEPDQGCFTWHFS